MEGRGGVGGNVGSGRRGVCEPRPLRPHTVAGGLCRGLRGEAGIPFVFRGGFFRDGFTKDAWALPLGRPSQVTVKGGIVAVAASFHVCLMLGLCLEDFSRTCKTVQSRPEVAGMVGLAALGRKQSNTIAESIPPWTWTARGAPTMRTKK